MHKVIGIGEDEMYLCNQAVSITLKKTTDDWNKVTCKNCLKQRYRSK